MRRTTSTYPGPVALSVRWDRGLTRTFSPDFQPSTFLRVFIILPILFSDFRLRDYVSTAVNLPDPLDNEIDFQVTQHRHV